MRLKKLEISGFKSFAHKTTLEFPTAIGAIVGPNGSGKSNVVDAIRWVLGEQSFKNLRSKSGVDLIWAGSETKSAQGKAGVSLYFDNRDGFFPIDFDDVVIGRRVYRDGINEYYLNNSQVRLKDIAELLARSKLGLRGHSIVNQGSADEILKSNPDERRGILEEALGLREFQLKKTEAETKLVETNQNLEQTAGLIKEISPHLNSLKRQVEKFKKREFLINDLNVLENDYFKAKISEILKERGNNDDSRKKIEEKIVLARRNFEDQEKILEKKTTEVSQTGEKSKLLEAGLEKLNAERHNIMREIGRIEGIIESAQKNTNKNAKTAEAVLAIKIKYWARRLNAIYEMADIITIKNAIKIVTDEIQVVGNYFERNELDKILSLADLDDFSEKQESPYEKDKNEFKMALVVLENKINGIKTELFEIRAEENKWRASYLNFQKGLEIARRYFISLEESLGKFNLEEEKIKIREADVKSEMWGSGKNYDEFIANFADAELSNDASVIIAAELQNKIIKLRREIADIGNVDEETMREYDETSKRHEFLTGETGDLNNAVESLKNLIKDLANRIDNDFKIGLAKINDEFNHYFRLMFGGGSAKLAVDQSTEEENGVIGVSINVNVPQKRIKDLNLLSGGERSLVSIALLFAIVAASRPPFLILDEVDAALDENNAVRFAKVLKDLAEKTQFVLITHNRATMEAAGVLYGVTMDGDGISKLFSLKLTDAVDVAKTS